MKTHRNQNGSAGSLPSFALALLALAAPAAGQYALDNNLQYGSRGINSAARGQRDIYQLRNAVLTGNVPSRSFRGNLGYTAPNDFRGDLGSDDLYRFARDSYYSGLALQGIRGIEATHLALADTDPNSFSRFSLSRSLEGVSLDEVRNRMGNRLVVPIGAPPAFSTISGAEFIRSASARTSDSTLRGSVLGYSSMQEGQLTEVAASSLRGLYEIPLVEGRLSDAAVDAAPPVAGPLGQQTPPTPTGSLERPANALQTLPRQDNRVTNRVPQPGVDPYTDLLDRFASAYASNAASDQTSATESTDEAPETADTRVQRLLTFDEQYRQLTELLQKRREEAATAGTGDTPPREGPASTTGFDVDLPTFKPAETPLPDVGELLDRYLPGEVREDLQITDLAGTSSTLFNEQMQRGEQLLAEGKYFDAEAQFSAALVSRPSQPLATLGKLNAQLGAGLFLSAGATLRGLAVSHPEVLAVTYDPDILPAEQRLEEVVSLLAERAKRQENFAPTAALLMGYLGHATGDAQLTRRGVERLEELGDPDELVPLLRALWLQEKVERRK